MRSVIGTEEEPGMSQQEDVVAHDAGQDDLIGSLQASSPAAEEDAEAQDRLGADDAEFDRDDVSGIDDDAEDEAGSPEADVQPSTSVADLGLEGEIAADY